MNERHEHGLLTGIAGGEPATPEQGRYRLVGFSPAELRRLVFIRWLYLQGRLSDFC